jgi:hypothetical protein
MAAIVASSSPSYSRIREHNVCRRTSWAPVRRALSFTTSCDAASVSVLWAVASAVTLVGAAACVRPLRGRSVVTTISPHPSLLLSGPSCQRLVLRAACLLKYSKRPRWLDVVRHQRILLAAAAAVPLVGGGHGGRHALGIPPYCCGPTATSVLDGGVPRIMRPLGATRVLARCWIGHGAFFQGGHCTFFFYISAALVARPCFLAMNRFFFSRSRACWAV